MGVGLWVTLGACNGNDKDHTDTGEEAGNDLAAAIDPMADPDADPGVAAGDRGRVRFVYLMPDMGPVDVFLDDDPIPLATDVLFLEALPYVTVPVGDHNVSLRRANDAGNAFAAESFEVALATDVTAIAYGSLASGTLNMSWMIDDRSAILPGSARVRIVHVVDGIEEVDVWNEATGDAIAEDLYFGKSVSVDVPAGTLRFGFDLDEDTFSNLTFSVPDLAVGEFVDLYGVVDQGPPFLLVQRDDGPLRSVAAELPGQFRVLHGSPALPIADVWVNESGPFVTGLRFSEGRDYLSLPAGHYAIELTATGQPAAVPVLYDFDVELQQGLAVSTVVWGAETVKVLDLVDDGTGLAPNHIRLQLVHGAEGLGQLDLLDVASETALAVDVDEGTVAIVDLASGARSLGFDLDDDADADVIFDVPNLGPGMVVDAVAVVRDGAPLLLIWLPDGTTRLVLPR